MFSPTLLVSALFAYLIVLFSIARWGDSAAQSDRLRSWRPLIYTLAIAVYCTSWTFYGAVGRAATSLADFLPIYLGPALVFLFGISFLRRLVAWSKVHQVNSIADAVASFYGRSRSVGVVAAMVCVLAVIPYIALQFKSIGLSFTVLGGINGVDAVHPFVFGAALGLIGFSVIYGTRHVSIQQSHHGLLLAIAFESLFKLFAFALVGLLALGVAGPVEPARHLPELAAGMWSTGFWIQTALAAIAIVCLPRQFHIGVVEHSSTRDLAVARWGFPAYLLIITAFVVPIVLASRAVLPPDSTPDSYVLLLPIALNHEWIALVVFLGGLSAASAMVIVSVIALASMISYELAIPQILRGRSTDSAGRNIGNVLLTRRVVIVGVIGSAYLFYLAIPPGVQLATTGLLAFVGIAQLAPALILGFGNPQQSPVAAMGGIVSGSMVWLWVMFLPAVWPAANSLWADGALSVMSPGNFFGLGHMDTVSRAALASLPLNFLVVLLVGRLWPKAKIDQLDTALLTPEQAGEVLRPFFGDQRVESEIQISDLGSDAARNATHRARTLLAGVMGAAAARQYVAEVAQRYAKGGIPKTSSASQVVEYSRELLLASLNQMSIAVSVVDQNQRLVAWNQSYQKLFNFPASLLQVGVPIEELVRFNASAGLLGIGDQEELIFSRLENLRSGQPHRHERELPNGTFLEIRGSPMPGGGYITSFSDVTDYKTLQRSLEERVKNRTEELHAANLALSQSKQIADDANQSKTRFLAGASHDLLQPLNAARLLAAVISQSEASSGTTQNAVQIEECLDGMEELLRTLLDISKIDAGVLPVKIDAVPVSTVLRSLADRFNGPENSRTQSSRLELESSEHWVHTDRAHLTRILQNFVANALRYSPEDQNVIVRCQKTSKAIRFEVIDSGPGISAQDQAQIFKEFTSGAAQPHSGPKGSGLGLSISKRLAELIQHPIGLDSEPGNGSVFWVEAPAATATAVDQTQSPDRKARHQRFAGLCVLCIDNDLRVLNAMQALLNSWGCQVLAGTSLPKIQEELATRNFQPDLILADFQLDDGASGVDVIEHLRQTHDPNLPAILITADHTDMATKAAEKLGVTVLRKPVKPASLGALMSRRILERSGR